MANKNITRRIKAINFSVLSPKEILKQSVKKVITPEIYDRYGFPVEGGLMDLKLGVIEPGLRCKTCGENYKNCEGHFGHLELSRPVLNVLYIDQIYNILRAISQQNYRIKCSDEQRDIWTKELRKIRLENGIDAYQKTQAKILTQIIKTNVCPHTGEKQEDLKLDKSSVFVFTQGEKNKRLLTTEIRFRFENIVEEDLELLGLINSRPEWLVVTQLIIPPVSMRSTITLASGQRSEDDLTHKLTDVVRTNQRLHEHLLVGVPEAIIEDVWDLLQYHISTYIDNTLPGLPPARHRNGDPLKSIAERIKGKKGIIRNNLIGKRVNYSARTVISPDPRLQLNEVGIPFEVAMRLTIPEVVTEQNIDFLKEMVKKGPLEYPGANYLRTKSGSKKRISKEVLDVLLEEIAPGYVIDRHLLEGDSVVFNRQPSLHKMSMMGHIIKVLPIKTFAINPGVCKPYNADFDGDEMNLHVSQTLEGRQEVERLMDVKHQLVSGASGETVIGCIQDSVTGLYQLSSENKTYSKEDALELLFSTGFMEMEKVNFKKEVTGREIFSALLPEELNFIGKSKNKEDVIIKKGQLIEGIIDKKIVGEGGGTLLRHLHKEYVPEKVLDLVRLFSNLGIQVLKKEGLTISMGDFDLDKKVSTQIKKLNTDVFKEVDKLIEDYQNDKIERIIGLTNTETFEINILKTLGKIRNEGLSIVENEIKEGGIITMNNAGVAKVLSIVQMHTGVGQQALRGQRIKRGFTDRTLSMFNKGDNGPSANGYIKSSLREGLKPFEFFYGSITGRDGLTDTALRTPKTGYLYRKMAASMLDLRTTKIQTVINDNGNIVQFKYGEDGIDVAKTMNGKFDTNAIIRSVLEEEK